MSQVNRQRCSQKKPDELHKADQLSSKTNIWFLTFLTFLAARSGHFRYLTFLIKLWGSWISQDDLVIMTIHLATLRAICLSPNWSSSEPSTSFEEPVTAAGLVEVWWTVREANVSLRGWNSCYSINYIRTGEFIPLKKEQRTEMKVIVLSYCWSCVCRSVIDRWFIQSLVSILLNTFLGWLGRPSGASG